MSITRRQLLTRAGISGLALGTGLFGLQRWKENNNSSQYLTNTAAIQKQPVIQKAFIGHCSPKKYLDHNNYLAVTEIESGLNYRIPTVSLPHGILKHSHITNAVICLPKFETTACEVNWTEKEMTRKFYAGANREFYGHGVFAKEGTVLLSTEVNTTTGRGVLVVRDPTDYSTIAEIDTYGVGPHDCRILPDNKTLVVANSGNYILSAKNESANATQRTIRSVEKSCITWIDLDSGKLLEKRELPVIDISMGHFEISNNILVAITMPQPKEKKDLSVRVKNCIYLSINHGPLISAEQILKNDGFVGEILSICIHPETATALVTNPDGKKISFWDIKNKKLKKTIELDSAPTGACVLPNQSIFVVSNHHAELIYFDAMSLTQMQKTLTAGVGSHLYFLS